MQHQHLPGFPTLTTKRLTLRQPLDTDVQEIYLLRSDPAVNKYLNRKPCETTEQAHNFIRTVNQNTKDNKSFYWAITETGSNNLVGTICLFNLSGEKKTCETGYELLPGYQGKGMMQEALEKVIEFAFETLGLDTIEAFTHKENSGSTQLLKKFHFEQTAWTDETDPYLIAFQLSQ